LEAEARLKAEGESPMEKESKVCELHKSLACEVDKGKFLRRVFGNKIFISIVGTTFLFAISWAVWVTNGVYVKAAEQSSEKATAQKTSKDIDEVKAEVKEIRNEIKGQTEAINKNQKDMLILLIEIQKEQRRANGSVKKGAGE